MPVYEYLCQKCKHVTEALRSMRDADEPQACSNCGSAKTKRQHSVFSPAVGSGAAKECPVATGGCGRCGDPDSCCPLN